LGGYWCRLGIKPKEKTLTEWTLRARAEWAQNLGRHFVNEAGCMSLEFRSMISIPSSGWLGTRNNRANKAMQQNHRMAFNRK